MEKVFNFAIEQSPDLQAKQMDEFLVYDVPEQHQGQKALFHNVITDYDEDSDNFQGQMTKVYGYVDFDEMDVCSPEECMQRSPGNLSDSDDMEELESSRVDQPILKPHMCIGPFHWAILLHSSTNLPQVLGLQLLESIALVNSTLEGHNAIIGFNSLLAGAVVNKLHIECILSTAFPDCRPVLLDTLQMEGLLYSHLTPKDKNSKASVNWHDISMMLV